jgi:glycine C-acetyltransferase
MPSKSFLNQIQQEIDEIKKSGLYKKERVITSPQRSNIQVTSGESVLNFCSNNYLGLCDNEGIIKAAKDTLDRYGFGLSSVRFICGTQELHLKLEKVISEFHGTEDTILFSSCFDANAGIFQALLTDQDAVFTDALNHASIIDGIRLCKAKRYIYKHLDMQDLERCLQEASKMRRRLIVTDGIFSMDGDLAPLDKICELAEKYDALVLVDESHAAGFIGKTGRGTPELFGVQHKVDLINSTLGKALGGATGGYTTGKKEIVEFLRQRARPYLFSNSVAPVIVGAALHTFELVMKDNSKVETLKKNTQLFRQEMKKAGFNIIGHEESPIVPVMIGDAKLAADMADDLLKEGIYVIGFSYPVVPKGQARIRVQLSAGHTTEQVKKCVDAFIKIGKQRKMIQ